MISPFSFKGFQKRRCLAQRKVFKGFQKRRWMAQRNGTFSTGYYLAQVAVYPSAVSFNLWIFRGHYVYHSFCLSPRFLFMNGKENMRILHFISKMVVHAHLIVYSKMTYMSTQLSFPLCPWFYACPYRHINCRQMLQKGTKRLHPKITRGFQWGICNDLLLVSYNSLCNMDPIFRKSGSTWNFRESYGPTTLGSMM